MYTTLQKRISLLALFCIWPCLIHAAENSGDTQADGFIAKGTLRYRQLFRSPSNPPEARSDYEVTFKKNQWKFVISHHAFGDQPLASKHVEHGYDGTNVYSVHWLTEEALASAAPKKNSRNAATASILNQPYPKSGWGYPELVWLAYASADFFRSHEGNRLPYWGIATPHTKDTPPGEKPTAPATWEIFANGNGQIKSMTYYFDNKDSSATSKKSAEFQIHATTNWHGKTVPSSFSFKQYGMDNAADPQPITEVLWALESIQPFDGTLDSRPKMTTVTRVSDERVPIGNRGVNAAYMYDPIVERDWRTTGQVTASSSYSQQLKTETVNQMASQKGQPPASSSPLKLMIFILPSLAILFLIIRSANKTKEKNEEKLDE